MTKLAIIQHAPEFLNLAGTIGKARQFIEEAAAGGAELIVFPEAFFPGYPAWIWRLRPGSDWNLSNDLHQRLLENSVDLDVNGLSAIQDAAKDNGVTVVCGLSERDGQTSRSTLYNSVVTIGPNGGILNRHRKLMPTNPERMVWGFGDGSGLNVVDTPCGRLGSLLCWENFMPLARYALYAQGIELYIAPTYDSGEGWIGSLRHIAREGCCWVIGAGVALRNKDLPEDIPDKGRLYPSDEDWINPGDSVVIAPGGDLVVGPVHETQAIVYADIRLEQVAISRRAFDVVGHYSRPDVFTLNVDTRARMPVKFS